MKTCAYCGKPGAEKLAVMLVTRARAAGVPFKLPKGVDLHLTCEAKVREKMPADAPKVKMVRKEKPLALRPGKGADDLLMALPSELPPFAPHENMVQTAIADILDIDLAPSDDLLATPRYRVARTARLALGTRVQVVYDWPHVTYYKPGDTGVVTRSWEPRREAEHLTYDMTLYEVKWDKPRDRDSSILHGYEFIVAPSKKDEEKKPAKPRGPKPDVTPTHDDLVRYGVLDEPNPLD